MMASFGFDPFVNADKLDEKAVRDLYSGTVTLQDRRAAFLKDPTPERASLYLQSQLELGRLGETLIEDALTVPVMVHVAAESRWEADPEVEGMQRMVQVCERCGSVLMIFNPGRQIKLTSVGPQMVEADDLTWYPVGARVAKVVSPDEQQEGSYWIDYEQQDEPPRPLESWEHECIGHDIPVLGED